MIKLRIKELIQDIGAPIYTNYRLAKLLGMSTNTPSIKSIAEGDTESIHLVRIENLVEGLKLDPDRTPLSALFDFGTGYRAKRGILRQYTKPKKGEEETATDTRAFFTTQEVKAMTGRSHEAIQKATQRGLLKAVPDSSPRVYAAAEVIRWLVNGGVMGNGKPGRPQGSKKKLAKDSELG